MISLSDIHVIFDADNVLKAHALCGVNLNIAQGEFITVIGSNGSGKSTLLNAIAGDVTPSQGQIEFNGNDIKAMPTAERAAMVARVVQDPLAGTCAQLTIAENLSLALHRRQPRGFARAITAVKRELFRQRIAPLGIGLENRLDDLVGELSGGQRQALSLMMATLDDSLILLLDEPTAALDPNMARFVLDLVAQIYTEHSLTILMVTHSMQSALALGNRTLMLDQGNIILDVRDEAREKMTANDLLAEFAKLSNRPLDNDAMLLQP